tara:strand:- start:3067 stop:4104 length:1038 start_codon:yes stop_codon:yes gene_type:complete
MRIALVLGPYRPGACGVSDYARLLGEKLEAKGHSCQRICIDPSLNSSFSSLAHNLPEVDLISLQFAPYAFSPNGLSGSALLKFGQAIRNRNLQVMFHEIWIGAYPRAPWMERWQGRRQKREILQFLEYAEPQTIYATNCAALDRLKQEGVDASHLYLFGNVPFAPLGDDHLPVDHELTVAFFGTLYDSFPYPLLSEQLLAVSKTTKQTVRLLILGRHREQGGLQALLDEAEKHDFQLEVTGELNSESLSRHLQESALGISTTPFDIMGKSGATAAMLEHGLPILAYDDGDTSEENLFVPEPFREQVFLLNEENISKPLIKFMQKPARPFFDGVSHVGKKMLEDIR